MRLRKWSCESGPAKVFNLDVRACVCVLCMCVDDARVHGFAELAAVGVPVRVHDLSGIRREDGRVLPTSSGGVEAKGVK